jgi:hypothetical protein
MTMLSGSDDDVTREAIAFDDAPNEIPGAIAV